ncbi:hypothetical protein IPZ77_15380 [Streptomyces sp. XC 2026]|nr:hypothetical protein IPZ77_15380 [Streptomyces sp. XC 2026]
MSVDGEGTLPGLGVGDGGGRLFAGVGLSDGKNRALPRLGMGGGGGGDVESQGGRAGGSGPDLHPLQLILGVQPDIRALGRSGPRHRQHDGGRFAPGGRAGRGPRGVTAAQLGRHRAQRPQQHGEQSHQRGRDDGRLRRDIAPFATKATLTAAH